MVDRSGSDFRRTSSCNERHRSSTWATSGPPGALAAASGDAVTYIIDRNINYTTSASGLQVLRSSTAAEA